MQSTASIAHLQAAFLLLLPRIETHARIYFRHLRCLDTRLDKVAETVALAWKWFLRLHEQGKDPATFPMAFAFLVARAVRCGRRLCGGEKSQEVFSPLAQQRHDFTINSLPARSTQHGNVFDEALQDNIRTSVPEQVHFRLDFPAWLATLSERDQQLLQDLALGERTLDVAHRHGVSPARISQLRREFHQGWETFCSAESASAGLASRGSASPASQIQ